MFKLSTRGRYGTRIMISLACAYGHTRSLREIAQAEDLSEGYLEQLIVSLKKAGLVTASRGARGGYGLACPPSQISLYDILHALEGGGVCPDCVNDPCVCGRSKNCATRPVWIGFERRIRAVAGSINLEDMSVCGCSVPGDRNEPDASVA